MWTRRGFLVSGLACSAWAEQHEKSAPIPSAFHRYTDPATELEVLRLTDPAHSSWLPSYYGRAIARHGGFLLHGADASGSPQAYQMDLHTGQSRQLTQAAHLDESSIRLLPDERGFCYMDGQALVQGALANPRRRPIYETSADWQPCEGLGVSDDGAFAVMGERRGESSRLRLIGLQRGAVHTVAEADWILSHPQPRPRRAQVLYRQGDTALWLVNNDGSQNRKLPLAGGRVGPACWSPDGKIVLYLQLPEDPAQLHSIREFVPDQNADQLVAHTSQFAHFGCNRNTSVFVGASANRGAPYILLLLRITRRELSLCEHRASDARMVAPIFSPDSQQIYFESDRDGKPAIYRMQVDRLVEKTEGDQE